ncbi:MAG: MgtC/SapB family protein, partial [Bacilli bacterium]|nr:MgtC/SapB family protein [Bacilli bacterium]
MQTVDEIIINWFNTDFGTNFSHGVFGNLLLVVVSLLLAAGLTGLIGLEREVHGHSAGLRTHLLVAIGSALIMVISIYGFRVWDSSFLPAASRDPARLAAQVVAGIGFIGAGTIVQNGISVRGLTTATTLWISMAIGLACGSGNFVIALIATAVSVIALISMRAVERVASRRHPILIVV